jgi:hypothetical protein
MPGGPMKQVLLLSIICVNVWGVPVAHADGIIATAYAHTVSAVNNAYAYATGRSSTPPAKASTATATNTTTNINSYGLCYYNTSPSSSTASYSSVSSTSTTDCNTNHGSDAVYVAAGASFTPDATTGKPLSVSTATTSATVSTAPAANPSSSFDSTDTALADSYDCIDATTGKTTSSIKAGGQCPVGTNAQPTVDANTASAPNLMTNGPSTTGQPSSVAANSTVGGASQSAAGTANGGASAAQDINQKVDADSDAVTSANARVSAANSAVQNCTGDDKTCMAAYNEQANALDAQKNANNQLATDKQTSGYQSDITRKDDAKNDNQVNCGRYGSANCSLTAAVNTAAPVIDKTASAFSAQQVSAAGAQSAMGLNSNTTQAQAAMAQYQVLTKAANAENTVEDINVVTAAAQAYRLADHAAKMGSITQTASGATNQINALATAASAPGSVSGNPEFDGLVNNAISAKCGFQGTSAYTACAAGYHTQAVKSAQATMTSYVTSNVNAETTAQQGAQGATAVAMMSTAAAITGHIQQKEADKAQAAGYLAYANAAQGTFAFNPSAPVANADDTVDNQTPVNNAVVAGTAPDTGLPGDTPLVNPNLDDSNVQSPTANPYVDATPAAAAAGTGGAYAGTTGGTSAAKDPADKNADANAAKSQTGGSYASGDGVTPKFSRGESGGGGVGLDGAFADLLKKFQPDDKKDAAGSMVFGEDRSPASERNAVLRQDQDIFGAISKRMQIKAQQGAIAYGDRT